MAKPLTPSMEDYLAAVYWVSRRHEEVRVKEIAEYLDVSLPSVTTAIRALRDADLVRHERYRGVTLTPEGQQKALQLADRHEALVRFMTGILLLDQAVAADEACRMEHAIGPTAFRRLVELMQRIQECPSGAEHCIEQLKRAWAQEDQRVSQRRRRSRATVEDDA